MLTLIPLLALLTLLPPQEHAALVLEDGQVLHGTTVVLLHGQYRLTLESGHVLPIPLELVRELRLGGWEPETKAPTGIRQTRPELLAGPPEPVRPPQRWEQLRVFGPPARFARASIDPEWRPKSDWTLDPRQNDFHPVRWYRPPVDVHWVPESAFDANVDVLAAGYSKWARPAISPFWHPRDGFDAWRARTSAPPRPEPEPRPEDVGP